MTTNPTDETITSRELAHAIDNSTPYPIELNSALCRFMAERLLEMLTITKRAEHPVWQPEEEMPAGPQPEPEDPAELRRLADEAQQQEPPVHGESVAHLAGLHDNEPAADARQDGAPS